MLARCCVSYCVCRRTVTSRTMRCASSLRSALPRDHPRLTLRQQGWVAPAPFTTPVPVRGAPAPLSTRATRGSTTSSRSAATRSTAPSRATTPTTTPRPPSTLGECQCRPHAPRCCNAPATQRLRVHSRRHCAVARRVLVAAEARPLHCTGTSARHWQAWARGARHAAAAAASSYA